jgi:HK97 family phage major capsid protein
MKTFTRTLDDQPTVNESDRTITAILSDESIALDKHVIKTAGWELNDYNKNSVVLWAHDQNAPPVAKMISILKRGKQLIGTMQFPKRGVYGFADTVFDLIKFGALNAVSVSWVPLESKPARDKSRPNGIDFLRQTLLEVSIVPCPANPNALITARSSGVNVEPLGAWARSAATTAKTLAQRELAADLARSLERRTIPAAPRVDEAAAIEARRARARQLAGEFKNIGEFGLALARAEHGDVDPRLLRAPAGAGETRPELGGFLVPEGFAEEIVGSLYEERDSILSYVQRFDIPDGTNSVSVPGVDETSRANGYRWGGVVADFADEGVAATASYPRLRATQFAAEKIIGTAFVSAEIAADVQNLSAFLTRAFRDELKYKAEQYILSTAGTGAGRPLSVQASKGLVVASKTTSQTAGTLSGANLRTMMSLLPAGSRRRAIWAFSESAIDVADSIDEVSFPASGSTNPDDLPRAKGRPIIVTDTLPAIGTQGDVLLFDPLWYGFVSKPMVSALSAHVSFLNHQMVFRLTWRVNGAPLVSSPIACTDGVSRGAFVALQAR